jgi:aminopeptidase N
MSFERRHHARCACSQLRALGAPRPFALPGGRRQYERDRPFAVRHISIDLALDVPRKAVEGWCTISFDRVDAAATTLTLDAVSFEIESVELDGGKGFAPAKHHYDGERIAVTIDAALTKGEVRVTYRANPRRGLYFLAPDEHVKNRPTQVWSQCQDEDARHWFPCHDKPHLKQTTELRVKVPTGWTALSNGKLASRSADGANEVFHFKQDKPHPTYLVTLVAGTFSTLEDGEVLGAPVSYLVPPGREEDGRRTFKETPGMIRHFSEVTGTPYPWAKYAQVVVSDFIFGGMENTSATTMYEHILLDDRAALDITGDDLIAHELAHQWFGDLVTCRDFGHGWLNEGFATYFEHVDRQRRLGEDEYEYGLVGDQEGYLGEARTRYMRPIVCHDYEQPIDVFDRHLYEKGGLVLHVLRRTLGDAAFWGGVKEYLRRHAYGIVETRDLQRALEDVSGRSLDRFFEQWVFKAGHPELEVDVAHQDDALVVTVKQTQKTGPEVPLFALTLELDIARADGTTTRETLAVERQAETFVIPAKDRPRFVVVDPRHLVLGSVAVSAPADLLRAQLALATTARGRWLAAAALAKRDDPQTVAALAAVVSDEAAFWGLRVEAASALGKIRGDEARAALIAGLAAVHPKARRGVVAALGSFRDAEAAGALRRVALSDASYLVEAEAARSLGGTRQGAAFDTLIEVLDRASWADVIRAGALDGLAALRDDRAIPHVTARTRYGVPTRARRAAIRALPKLSSDRKTRELLEDLLEDPDPYLRVDVAIAVGELGDAKSRGPLARALERELDGRVKRRLREVSRDLGGGPRAEHERLKDELDKLRDEQRELRTRLAKLEAKSVIDGEGSEKKKKR